MLYSFTYASQNNQVLIVYEWKYSYTFFLFLLLSPNTMFVGITQVFFFDVLYFHSGLSVWMWLWICHDLDSQSFFCIHRSISFINSWFSQPLSLQTYLSLTFLLLTLPPAIHKAFLPHLQDSWLLSLCFQSTFLAMLHSGKSLFINFFVHLCLYLTFPVPWRSFQVCVYLRFYVSQF